MLGESRRRGRGERKKGWNSIRALSDFISTLSFSDNTKTLLALLSLAFAAPACVDDEAGQGAASGGSDGAELCAPNTGDGRTQCGSDVCEAGERCTDNGLVQCLPGCLETLNCGPQQWCDLRTADPGEAGLCRSVDDAACGGMADAGADDTSEDPSSGGDTMDSSGASCPDVQGNYSLSLRSSSPPECQEILSNGDTCSVSQDACNITWGCDGTYASLLVPGAVDSSGVYETSGTYMGFSYVCEVEFLDAGSFGPDLEWSCSVGQGGQAILCEGTGTL